MTTLNTLESLIDDIREEIRNNNISESENISKIQIEQWIHQYRSLLIKQDLDKGRYTNPNYIQRMRILCSKNGVLDNIVEYKYLDLPTTIDLHFKQGITSIIDNTTNKEIQLMTNSRSLWNKFRKFSSKEEIARLKYRDLYIDKYYLDTTTASDFLSISVDGIFEDPSRVPTFSYKDIYPIPANMIPVLKEMIFKKEFGILLSSPTDDLNNSSNDIKNLNQK